MEQERVKQNHLNRHFSLLLFRITDWRKYQHCLDTIGSNIRDTDIAGIYDNYRIGVILPETASSGAWVVENRLAALLQERHITTDSKISTHLYLDYEPAYTYQPLNEGLPAF